MKELKTFPNQNVLILKAHEVAPNSTGFFKAYNEDILKAAKELNGAAFKVYMYLVTTTFMGKFAFSPAAIAGKTGISVRTAQDAYKELIEKGYIEIKDNNKTFNWVAKEFANVDLVLEEEQRRFKTTTGKEAIYTYEQYCRYWQTKRPDIAKETIDRAWTKGEIVQ